MDEGGFPDGMAIDQDGKLWVAGYLASKVMQFDPETGESFRSIFTQIYNKSLLM